MCGFTKLATQFLSLIYFININIVHKVQLTKKNKQKITMLHSYTVQIKSTMT